jgi:hypothetical protein
MTAARGVATYTVGEMAARVSRTGAADEVATITRQLRNWTGLGLLRPLGEKHEGTGRHRLYDNAELMKAALLETLARNFKVDVTGLQSFVGRYESQGSFFPTMLINGAMGAEQYPFWIGFSDGKALRFGFSTAPDILDVMKAYELVVVLDAAPIAKRIFT